MFVAKHNFVRKTLFSKWRKALHVCIYTILTIDSIPFQKLFPKDADSHHVLLVAGSRRRLVTEQVPEALFLIGAVGDGELPISVSRTIIFCYQPSSKIRVEPVAVSGDVADHGSCTWEYLFNYNRLNVDLTKINRLSASQTRVERATNVLVSHHIEMHLLFTS